MTGNSKLTLKVAHRGCRKGRAGEAVRSARAEFSDAADRRRMVALSFFLFQYACPPNSLTPPLQMQGPSVSSMTNPSQGLYHDGSSESYTYAQELPLSHAPFYAVEFPGYVGPTSDSTSRALRHLGGQSRLDHAFRRGTNKKDRHIELSFRPDSPFAHPVSGEVVQTNNILLKIVKRRRKDGGQGEYTAEAVGVISKTVRFRSEARLPNIRPENSLKYV
jgi:hypothetical protein